jgi:hypothetical protein
MKSHGMFSVNLIQRRGRKEIIMKTGHILLAVVLFFAVCHTVFAERQLDEAETLGILQQLTSQPKKTWIPAGIIEATHEEYKAPKVTDLGEINNQINQKVAEYQNNLNKPELTENLQKMKLDAVPFNVRYKLSNEYTMTSTVILRFDGDRFYWEINVNSRTDSVKPDKNLTDNFMTDEFNLDWNARRIFAWDGENYTTYSSGNHAIVDSRGNTPHIVNGPLTAGFIPWGYGHYSYDSLVAAGPTAVEKIVDDQTQIHLTLNNLDGMQMSFVLDAAKNYAVLSCSIETFSAIISKQYGNYHLVNGNWVPTTILLERFEAGTNRLLARDLWNLTTIDGNTPGIESFDVEFKDDALIEYASYITNKPAMYHNRPTVDIDALLTERLAYAANEDGQQQNCATAALKYVAGQLGRKVADSQLAEMVTEPTGDTSLLAMKQFAQSLGFYCKAVTADINTLRNLDNCQIILHIPGKKHFVVLESIDDIFVRVIDLASDKFYYRTDINFFGMDWTEGTALLVSNSPVTGDFTKIADTELASIIGASGYACTLLLQEYNVIYCVYVGGQCEGNYQIYWQRWGCESAPSGSCSTSRMERLRYSPCIEDLYDPFNCTITGAWTFYYMRACA